ncbi:MAG TPA: hypothetical protein VEY09_04130 [Pyrinomonadaceae bacterium]|nr:hypothetical protein [Pyrinomonadaceae bacterium]
MRSERQIRHILKLRLLALVLALALGWYALNPAPGPVRLSRRGPEDEPDEQRREEKSAIGGRVAADAVLGRVSGGIGSGSPPPKGDVEELDWPEYLHLD